MKPSFIAAVAFVSGLVSTSPRSADAQSPCAVAPIAVDSARDEVLSVLTSGGAVIQEIRQEQGLANAKDLSPIKVVRDASVCARLADGFGRPLNRGTTFVVLRVGPLYYAREPDQRRGTGILTDSTFRVLARLGPAIR